MNRTIMAGLLAVIFCGQLTAEEYECECQYETTPCPTGNWYGSLFGGIHFQNMSPYTLNLVNIDTDPGFAGTLSLGYRFDPCHRLETEFGYRRNAIKGFDQLGEFFETEGLDMSNSTFTWMVNFINTFPTRCNLTPYWGFGVGYANAAASIRLDGVKVSLSNSSFCYQGILGLSTHLQEQRELGVEYRYLGVHQNVNDHSVGVKLTQHF